MKKGIKRAAVALILVFAMSIGMLASANYSDVGDSVILFYDQYNKGDQTTYADISDVGGGWLKSYWTLYNGDNGNAQISYSDMSGKKVAGFGVHFGVRSDYFWYTVSSDRNLNYPTDKKVDTVKFGTMVSAANMKIYRYSNLIYNNGSYCMIRQASKLTMVGDTLSRTVKIYTDGNYLTEVTKTFPNRDDDTTMVAEDVYVTNLYGPYYTWSRKVENGYYRIDLKSRYTVTASVANSKGSASVAASPVDYGGSTTATFTASSGYHIDYVTDNGTKKDVTNASSYTYTVSSITSARNIVATTTPINYSISYNLDGGSVSGNPSSYNIESSFTLKNPTKTGYTFAGWTGTGISGVATSVSVAAGNTGNRSYTATWNPNTYTVTYDGNGATSGSTASQTFQWDESKALSSNGFKKEYSITYDGNGGTPGKTSETAAATFNGWEDRNDIIYNGTTYLWSTFDAPYYSNAYGDLYNAFGYNKYSLIAHYVNNGRSEGRNPIDPSGARNYYRADRLTVSNLTTSNGATLTMYANWSLKNVTLPTATRDGYTFDGWYNGSTKVGNAGAVYTPTANVTLTAMWTPINYNITYNLDGGSVSGNPASYNPETATFTLKNPTKSGYDFLGWTGSNGSTPQTTVEIAKGTTGDKTYTANWKRIVFTVKWVNHDGTILRTDTVNYGETPSYGATPTRESSAEFHYTFKEWSPSVVATTDDVTYTATYTETKREYPITFKNEDGTVLLMSDFKYGAMPSYSGSTPQKEQTETEVFTFAGWNVELSPVTGEAEYVATYTSAPREYTITWVNYDGEVLKTDAVAYNTTPTYDGETPRKPKDTQYRYEFAGWSPEIVPVTVDAEYMATYNPIELPPVADLKIVTSGCDVKQSFVFSVESLDDAYFAPIEVAIIGNGEAVIKELPTGRYAVTEETNWTWRYGNSYEKTITVLAGEENIVTFRNINEPTIKKWLTGLASLFN